MIEDWTSADVGWANYCAEGGTLSNAQYVDAVANWGDAEGRRRLLIEESWRNDRHRPGELWFWLTESELARIASDYAPAVGMNAPEALFGWVASQLDGHQPTHRNLALSAMAAFLFACPGYKGKPLYRYWLRNKPRVSSQAKDSVVQMARAPMGLWRVDAVGNGTAQLSDCIGLGHGYQPDGPVRFRNLPLAVGQSILCRVLRTQSEQVAVHPVVLPAMPDASHVQDAVSKLLWHTRIHYRNASVEDALRWRGHTFHKACVEWAFAFSGELPYCGDV